MFDPGHSDLEATSIYLSMYLRIHSFELLPYLGTGYLPMVRPQTRPITSHISRPVISFPQELGVKYR